MVFKEPIHKIIEWIKNELYFRWPSKMGRDPSRRNQTLYYTYHREKGHTIEECRVFKDHLEQLMKVGHLKEFMVEHEGNAIGQMSGTRGTTLLPPLGIIEVIHASSINTRASQHKGVLNITPQLGMKASDRPEKRLRLNTEPIAFRDDDLEGTS